MERLSPVLVILGGEPTHWCPGCRQIHRIDVNESNRYTGARWTWDGNKERPTFAPSINIVGRCHYFIKDGRIEFCGDCSHSLAGKIVPLPVFPQDEYEGWQKVDEAEHFNC